MADEASIATVSWQQLPSANGQGAANQYNLGLEYDTRVTKDFGVVINWGAWLQRRRCRAEGRGGAHALLESASPAVGPGDHQVVRHVTSIDGHMTQGRFRFGVEGK